MAEEKLDNVAKYVAIFTAFDLATGKEKSEDFTASLNSSFKFTSNKNTKHKIFNQARAYIENVLHLNMPSTSDSAHHRQPVLEFKCFFQKYHYLKRPIALLLTKDKIVAKQYIQFIIDANETVSESSNYDESSHSDLKPIETIEDSLAEAARKEFDVGVDVDFYDKVFGWVSAKIIQSDTKTECVVVQYKMADEVYTQSINKYDKNIYPKTKHMQEISEARIRAPQLNTAFDICQPWDGKHPQPQETPETNTNDTSSPEHSQNIDDIGATDEMDTSSPEHSQNIDDKDPIDIYKKYRYNVAHFDNQPVPIDETDSGSEGWGEVNNEDVDVFDI